MDPRLKDKFIERAGDLEFFKEQFCSFPSDDTLADFVRSATALLDLHKKVDALLASL